MQELSLWLDSYNDIYSDFDSNSYLKRRISEDFLHELRNEVKLKENHVKDMFLILPENQRDQSSEMIIIASLKAFFSRKFDFHHHKCVIKLRQGLILFITGILIMLLYSWISFHLQNSFFVICLKVLLEPAGWFLVWAAFDFLFYDYSLLRKDEIFFENLYKMNIHFRSE